MSSVMFLVDVESSMSDGARGTYSMLCCCSISFRSEPKRYAKHCIDTLYTVHRSMNTCTHHCISIT